MESINNSLSTGQLIASQLEHQILISKVYQLSYEKCLEKIFDITVAKYNQKEDQTDTDVWESEEFKKEIVGLTYNCTKKAQMALGLILPKVSIISEKKFL